uniref:Cytochrome P450 52-E3 n=2 Tax=Trichomonascaceae TaxID=410830 RepID=CP52E_STABO|nr:RecName: Full=Cytochrome P450 52-E3; Short=CYP52-E3; AltName: Full=Cytochrome P450 monooxygenase CYP52-E3 [Starmerella bombicola]ACD75400.1 cytochrome P450 monooxygenase CYP52-E3 [Starmerella bombicola]AIY55346.1 cytochrome P450 monooxygenase CYP52-E2 [Wickerhamiella domercqiae]
MNINFSDVLVLGGISVSFLLAYQAIYFYFIYSPRAKKLGCALPPVFFSFPLGIPEVIRLVNAWFNDDLLEYFTFKFEEFQRKTGFQSVAGQLWIGTIEPENIKTMLATSFKDYSLGFRYEAMYGLLGNGIFTLSGEGWKHSRALLRPQFSREQVSHLESMRTHINMLINNHFKGGKVVDAQVLFHNLTIDTATEFLFGESTNTLDPALAQHGFPGPKGLVTGEQFAEAFTSALELLSVRVMAGAAWFLVWTPKFWRSCKVCHNFIDYFVFKALATPMEKDQEADRYVFIRELTKETSDPRVIRDQALNILLAGRDTTAALLSFTTYYLGAYPEVYDELREAVIADFGKEDAEPPTFEQLKQCKVLQNVIREVLRLHPNVPLNFREAITDTKFPTGGGPNGDQPVFVPKGQKVFYATYVMQRNEGLWGPDSTTFRPDRWNESREAIASGWDYIPFNGGPRICLGQQFALTEASYTLVRICQEFSRIEVLHPDVITSRNVMKQRMRLTNSSSGGVIAKFIR